LEVSVRACERRFADFDGGNRRLVLDGSVPHVFSLTVFEDWMYWSDWNHMAIEKANRFTGANRTVLVNVTHRPMTVRVVHPLRQRHSQSAALASLRYNNHYNHLTASFPGQPG